MKIEKQDKQSLQKIHDFLISSQASLLIDFIKDEELKKIITQEYQSLVYMEQLQNMLQVSNESDLHTYLKFQIVQYASIYEAIIDYLLFSEFTDHQLVKPLLYQEEVKQIPKLQNINFKIDSEDVFFYKKKIKRSQQNFIAVPFKKRVEVASQIGLISVEHARKIKYFYDLRNSIHIRARANKKIDFEIKTCESAKNILPNFLEKINEFQEISQAYKGLASKNPKDQKESVVILCSIAKTGLDKREEILSSLAHFVKSQYSAHKSFINVNPEIRKEVATVALKGISDLLTNESISSLDISSIRLENANLGSSNFHHVCFKNSILNKIDFSSAYLRSVNFQNSELKYTNFQYANLRNSDFSNANLSGSNLQCAKLNNADLWKCNLQDATLKKANLKNACLEEANLQNANLSSTNLEGMNLRNTNLKDADLSYSNLSYADLSTANLQGTNLSNADLSHATLCEADLSYANLENAMVSKANLRDADLSYADLSIANFRKSNLTDAKLIEANLFRTYLFRANLEGVNLQEANCYQVEGLGEVGVDQPLEDMDFLH